MGRQVDSSEACYSLTALGAVVKKHFWLWMLLTTAVDPPQVCEEEADAQTILVSNNSTHLLSNTSSTYLIPYTIKDWKL